MVLPAFRVISVQNDLLSTVTCCAWPSAEASLEKPGLYVRKSRGTVLGVKSLQSLPFCPSFLGTVYARVFCEAFLQPWPRSLRSRTDRCHFTQTLKQRPLGDQQDGLHRAWSADHKLLHVCLGSLRPYSFKGPGL